MTSVDKIILELEYICDKDGKETYPKLSAKLFHKLGIMYKEEALESINAPKKKKLYRKLFQKKKKKSQKHLPTECKIKLIQSVALLNAAIVREPDNVLEIKQDLIHLCDQLVVAANRELPKNLVEYSKAIERDVITMRDNVNQKLKTISQIKSDVFAKKFTELKKEKIRNMCDLQHYITRLFAEIMELLAGFCEEIMGKPPCKYALVGLGSLSRKEITPYSDFENIIVLEDDITDQENNKEYFRWFAVIFQVILINLGETILPAVYIPCLNNGDPNKFNFYDAVTPLGISFDGMMPHACKSPLGRQMETEDKPFTLELIQTSSKMASFIGSDEDIKNGYHLADMLMTTCFVAGSIEVYQQFQEFVDYEIKLLDKKIFTSTIEQQINENTKDFLILTQLKQLENKSQLNIKRMIYRSSTLFVSAIGKLHGIKECCCFDILDKLIERCILTESVGHDLKFAIAIACETRLRVYMYKKSQDDVVKQSEIKRKFIKETVGMKSVLEYLLIISSFKKNIFNLDEITGPELNLVPQICYYLQNYEYAINWAQKNLYKQNVNMPYYRKLDVAYSHCFVGICKHNCGKYNAAMIDFKISLEIQRNISINLSKDKDISYSHYRIGLCKYELFQYVKALGDFQTSLEIEKKISPDMHQNKTIAERYYWIGNCKYELGIYREAIHDLELSLDICNSVEDYPNKEKWVASCKYWVGLCQYQCGNYEEALNKLQDSHMNYKKIIAEPTQNRISNCLYWIGLCNYKTNQHAVALVCFKDSLKILKEIVSNPSNNKEIAERHYAIAICQHEKKDYDNALVHFMDALKIHKNVMKHEGGNATTADCYYWVGKCKFELSKYTESLHNFNNSLSIYKTTGKESTEWIASCHYWIGLCKYQLAYQDGALLSLRRALKAYNELNSSGSFSDKIASCEYWIKKCDCGLKENEECTVQGTSGNKRKLALIDPHKLRPLPKLKETNLYQRKLKRFEKCITKDIKQLYSNLQDETMQRVICIIRNIFDNVFRMTHQLAKYKRKSTIGRIEIKLITQLVLSNI